MATAQSTAIQEERRVEGAVKVADRKRDLPRVASSLAFTAYDFETARGRGQTQPRTWWHDVSGDPALVVAGRRGEMTSARGQKGLSLPTPSHTTPMLNSIVSLGTLLTNGLMSHPKNLGTPRVSDTDSHSSYVPRSR